ncbi:MAG: TadE/TadG family type IV pilus assembly protein [Roseovarius sp.]
MTRRAFKSRRSQGFVHGEDGSVLALVAVTISVILGFLALTFDFGRLAVTQSELQSFVDNVALSAAGELDGKADAVERATRAAQQMISDNQTFGQSDATLSGEGDYSIAFYKNNPAVDSTQAATTTPTDARYVKITSAGDTVQLGFAAAFGAMSGQDALRNDVGADAVAGFVQSTCDITPLMFCAPSADWKAEDNAGQSVLLRTGGNGAGWGPGAFGYIDPANGVEDNQGACGNLSGSKQDVCLIAATQARSGCFSSSGVNIRTGQSVGVYEAALNIRFDIYESSVNQLRNDPLYAPAPNVIKEGTGGACTGNGNGNSGTTTITLGLPQDDCHLTGSCDRYGDGNWSTGRAAYVAANYRGTDPHPQAQTRYAYYLAEIAAAGGASSSQPILPGNGETGRPQCSRYQSDEVERRVMVAAAIDCSAHSLQSSGRNNVPILEFVSIFMIKPIGQDGTRDFWVEVVGGLGGGSGGSGSTAVVRDVVKLYK